MKRIKFPNVSHLASTKGAMPARALSRNFSFVSLFSTDIDDKAVDGAVASSLSAYYYSPERILSYLKVLGFLCWIIWQRETSSAKT